jgi:hypothetical protein
MRQRKRGEKILFFDEFAVEYLIHLQRLRLLHHLPSGTSIEQLEKRLKTFFETQQLQTPIQISNTIKHIYNLIL